MAIGNYAIVFIADIVALVLAGAYCSVSKSIRLPTTCAFVVFVIFNILLAHIHVQASSTNIWGYPIFLGVALGMCLSSLLAVAQLSTCTGWYSILVLHKRRSQY
jgi:hypothetical protein